MPSGGEAAAAYEHLREFFEYQKTHNSYQKIFASRKLFDIAGGVRASIVATALSSLVIEGILDQIVRVEPHYGEGIGDFKSIEEVPDVIEDWRHSGREIKVLPEYLQIYYKLHKQHAR